MGTRPESDSPRIEAKSTHDLGAVSEAAINELVGLIRTAFTQRNPQQLEEAAARASELSDIAAAYHEQQQSVLAHIVAHELRGVCAARQVTTDNWDRIEETCARLLACVAPDAAPLTRREPRASQSGTRRRVDVKSDPQIEAMLDRVFETG